MEAEVEKYMNYAEFEATLSKNTTKVGAIIVNPITKTICSSGFNKFPDHILNLEIRHDKSEKLFWTLHAEICAIINAGKNGKELKGCDMYINYFPCSNCAAAIIESGIKRLFVKSKPDFDNERWGKSWQIAKTMFNEANVEMIFVDEI